jgi:hypothetical protein
MPAYVGASFFKMSVMLAKWWLKHIAELVHLLIPLAALTLPNSIIFRNDENFKFFVK